MASQQSINRHFTCSICLEQLKVPKTLPCLHNFCEHCLSDHIRVSKIRDTSEEFSFECPLCRASTIVATPQHTSKWASNFPTNHLIVTLLEDDALKVNTLCKERKEDLPTCTPCAAEGKTEAKSFCFCVICQEYYCKNCYEDHKKFKSTRGHHVLKGEELPMNDSVFEKITHLSMCDLHPDKELEFRCSKHNKFLCAICATSGHRKCKGLVHLTGNVSDGFVNIEDSMKDILPFQKDIEKLITQKLSNADHIGRITHEAEQSTLKIKHELEILIQQFELVFKEKFAATLVFEQQRLTRDISELVDLNEAVRELVDVVKVGSKHGSIVQKQILQDWFTKQTAHIRSSIDSKSDNMKPYQKFGELIETLRPIKLNIQSELDKLFETLLITESTNSDRSSAEIPHLITNNDFEKSKDFSKINVNDRPVRPPEKARISEMTLSLLEGEIERIAEHDISVSGSAAKPCIHNGSVLLEDGKMVFIDRSNQLIKLVTMDFRVQSHRLLTDKPCDLLSIKDGNIALATRTCIFVFKVGKQFEEAGFFPLKEAVVSLCWITNEYALLLSKPEEDCTNYSIEFRNKEFKVVNKIESFDSFGKDVYMANAKKIRSRFRKEVLVCTPKQIMSFELNGHQKWWFTKPDIRHLNYIAFDSKNNVYVSDLETGSIHQIAACSYQKHRVILKNIQKPASILFNPKDSSLVIGCYDNDKIYIYQFMHDETTA